LTLNQQYFLHSTFISTQVGVVLSYTTFMNHEVRHDLIPKDPFLDLFVHTLIIFFLYYICINTYTTRS
jgi:hypothetical protein